MATAMSRPEQKQPAMAADPDERIIKGLNLSIVDHYHVIAISLKDLVLMGDDTVIAPLVQAGFLWVQYQRGDHHSAGRMEPPGL